MPEEFGDSQFGMECVPEPLNRFDRNAVLVKDMGSGTSIGRVPIHICNVISVRACGGPKSEYDGC